MAEATKRCSRCEANYRPGHWAHKRLRCPGCGALLEEVDPGRDRSRYQHYDSSVDVRFDLSELLSPDQHKEARTMILIGIGLILAAFAGRILFSLLGGLEGFWGVPLWFDGIVLLMIALGSVVLVWSVRRILAHRRAMRRDPLQDS